MGFNYRAWLSGFACLFGSVGAPALSIATLDKMPLSHSQHLRHIAAAIDQNSAISARDLVLGPGVTYARAPDPSELLRFMQRKNSKPFRCHRQPLRLLSYNVALLEANLFGFFNIIKSPFLEERRELQTERIFSVGADVIFLQEVWRESAPTFQRAAKRHGYEAFYGPKLDHDDGLMTFVRTKLAEDTGSVELENHVFKTQYFLESYSGAGKKRAFLRVTLHHNTLGTLHLYNTHLLSFRATWQHRMRQARELGRYITYTGDESDLVFVGGDLNAGPYYKDNEWQGFLNGNGLDWWANAGAYPVLLHYGQLNDLMIMGLTHEDADIEVRLGKTVPNAALEPEAAPETMMAWCRQTPHVSFTASDCNRLHHLQYPGFEQPARQDHLLVRDFPRRVQVVARDLFFTEREVLAGTFEAELSDHYGVMADTLIEHGCVQ